MTFRNRSEAGRLLARKLKHLRSARPVVVAVPPGGIEVAVEIACELGAELDTCYACELAPRCGTMERSAGAVAEGGAYVVERALARRLGIAPGQLDRVLAERRGQAERHGAACRGGRPRIALHGRTVIVVADGMNGCLAPIAVLRAVRAAGPARLVLAVPVADPGHLPAVRAEADEIVVLDAPPEFIAVGYWYTHPAHPTDEEVAVALSGGGARVAR